MPVVGRVVGRWWNGQWGRTARKDIWLEQRPDGTVLVRWREGDGRREGERVADGLPHAESAALWLREHGDPWDRWVDWTGLYVR